MAKKVVVIRDFTVRQSHGMDRFKYLEEKYGAELTFVEDQPEIETGEQFAKMFLTMEKHGPDAVRINEALIAAAKDADIIISHISPICTAAVNAAEHLEAVCILRSGVENIKLENATARGVKVINAPGRLAVPVSEFTVGLIISEIKNIARSHARTMAGQFNNRFANSGNSFNLKGKNIGLVGCGAVGARVAKIMKAFEANVLIFDPYMDPKAIADLGYTPVGLNELCSSADVVSVHYRLTPETEGLIGREQFALMKPSCYFINTARAGLVDEAAMMEALTNKRIGGAGLDVFHQEPLTADNPLLKLDNVTLTSHLAGSCSDIFDMTFDIMAKTVDRYFETGEWEHIVNK